MQNRHVTRRRLFVALLAGLLIMPSAVHAAPTTANALRGDVIADSALVELYPYGSGTNFMSSTQADFDAGVGAGTSTTVIVDSLTLERLVVTDPDTGLAAWWDPAWIVRQCFELDHTAPGASDFTDHPVRLPVTLASTAGLRAIAADDTSILPHWVNGADVWVKVDLIAAGTIGHVCVYGENPTAGETSDLVAAVTSALRPAYVTANENAAGRSVTVVSYSDGNVVSTGIETVYGLDAGQSYTFTSGITAATVFSVLAPISSRLSGQGADALVPLSWAGTEFVFPSTRGTQRFSVHAPGPDANVTFYRGSAGSTVSLLVSAGTTGVVNADGGSRAVVAISDQPVVITHEGTNNRDVYGAYPSTTVDLYGVPSTRHYLSTNTNGTSVSVWRSDGTSQSFTVNRFVRRIVTPNGATYGNGPAARMSADAPVGSIQQADGNGSESTTFLPASALSSVYYLPTDATYVAFACPTPGTVIDVTPPSGPATSVTCSSPGLPFPGKARIGSMAAGTQLRSQGGAVFYAYYQDNATNDETNLLGPVAGEVGYPAAVISARTPTGIYRSSGSWTSPTFDPGAPGVFGLVAWSGNEPAGTTLRLQVATAPVAAGPFTFVGPDGTPASYYEHPGPGSAIFDYSHDGNRFAQVRAALSTGDVLQSPRLDDVTIETGLVPSTAAPGSAMPVSVTADGGLHHLVRVRAGGLDYSPSSAHLQHLSDSNLANLATAEAAFDAFAPAQLEYAAGLVITGRGADEAFSPPAAYSITLSESTISPGQATVLDIVWRVLVSGSSSTYLERPLEVTILS